ncbi:MAG: TPM domain-containing protein, partial [Gemmatimonadota bacterium]
MTRRKAIAPLLVLQLGAGLATASAQDAEGFVPPRPTGYVSDFAAVVDPASEARMTALITRLRGATGAEIAVVTLPTVGDNEASEVAYRIGRRWGVGAAAEIGDSTRNAGIVMLLVPRRAGEARSGQIRIEVGRGLEGIVTDAASGRIRDLMLPQLSREAYGPGLLEGVSALSATIARGYGVTDSALTSWRPPPVAPGGGGGGGSFLPLLLFILIFFLLSSRRGRGRRRGIYWGGP